MKFNKQLADIAPIDSPEPMLLDRSLELPSSSSHQPNLQVIDRVKIQQGIDERADSIDNSSSCACKSV